MHLAVTTFRYNMHMYWYNVSVMVRTFLAHIILLPPSSSSAMTYRILVVGEGKHFGLSTACLYINLAGEFAETGVHEIPRGEYQIEITVCR